MPQLQIKSWPIVCSAIYCHPDTMEIAPDFQCVKTEQKTFSHRNPTQALSLSLFDLNLCFASLCNAN